MVLINRLPAMSVTTVGKAHTVGEDGVLRVRAVTAVRLLQNNLDEVKRTLEEHAEELKRSRGKDEVPGESSVEVQCDNKNTLRTGSRVVTPPVDGLGLPTGTTIDPPPVEGPPLPTGTKIVNAK